MRRKRTNERYDEIGSLFRVINLTLHPHESRDSTHDGYTK